MGGFLKRVLGGGDGAPGWARFMTGEEYRAFEAIVVSDLTARGYSLRITGDGGIDAQGGPHPGIFGLFNIAQVCHMSPRTDWPKLVGDHFENLLKLQDADATAMSWDEAKPRLRVRTFRVTDTPPEVLERLVKVEMTPDLQAALALDLPTSVRTCSQDDVDAWGLSVEELFEQGKANLASEWSDYEHQFLPLKTGRPIEFAYGDSFFVASQAVRLDTLIPDAPHGALVAMPNRHQLAWHRIVDAASTVDAVQGLLRLAARGYDEGPGSLTPDLYWWRAGTWTLLPATVDKKGAVQFFPPDEFMALLNEIATA